MSPKSILLTSASGNIGRELIPLLLKTTHSDTTLILPTSSASRLSSTYPNEPRISISEGSVSDPPWLESLCKFHRVETAFLNLGYQDELFTTIGALDAFARAGVKHVIYLSCAGEFTSPPGVAEMLSKYGGASIVVKVAVEQKLFYGRYPFKWTVIGPTLFFENDLRDRETLLREGVLPEPLGEKGVSRVSCADVALAVAKSVEDGGRKLGGRKVNVGALRRFTGRDTSSLWSEALGRQVRVNVGDESGMEAYEQSWQEVAPGTMGKAIARDVSIMCSGWVEHGFGLSEDEYRFCRAVLGKEADDYEEWVRRIAKDLKDEK